MVSVTMLGTAATMPRPDRALAAATICCEGRSILLDCGEGTQTAARKAHISLMKTDLIALTHYHGDHIFGLPGLLQTFSCLGRTSPLFLTGPEGLEDAVSPILRLSGELSFPVKLLSLPEKGICMHDLCSYWSTDAFLFPVQTLHRVPSSGYCFSLRRPGKFNVEAAEKLGVPLPFRNILQKGTSVTLDDGRIITSDMVLGRERPGLRVVFTGDTAPTANLISAAANADLLICEATYGDDCYADQAGRYGHCTFSQAAAIAAESGAKRLWLTHFSQIMENPEDYLPNASSVYPDAVCGYDGMSILLTFPEQTSPGFILTPQESGSVH